MVDAATVRWQNKAIAAQSDFRGLRIMALLVAWYFFLWQFLSLPALATTLAALPPLMTFALAKGNYMPDFGMIIAGFCIFHFRRELRIEWKRAVAIRLYLAILLPLLAYLALALILFEIVQLTGPAHAWVLPWRDPLMVIQFRILATTAIAAILVPPFLFGLWTYPVDVTIAGVVLCAIYDGFTFYLQTHRFVWMWPSTALVDFATGMVLCSALFRGVTFLAAVRGPTLIMGWVALMAGSIIDGPLIFFLGFLMIVGALSLNERTWFAPGERALLLWSRTAFAIVLIQPAILSAWAIWGGRLKLSGWAAFFALAVVTQLLAVLLYLAVEPPLRRLLKKEAA